MLSKLKLRFTSATILIAALLLSIVMTATILVIALEIRYEIDRKISTSLDASQNIFFGNKDRYDELDCMLVYYVDDTYHTVRSEQYTEQEQREIIERMVHTTDKSIFSYGNQTFIYDSKVVGSIRIYAVYDATVSLTAFNHTWRVTVVAFSAMLVVIALIAWALSGGVVKPVSDAVQKQKDLIANASHELKTPLTIIDTDLTLAKSSIQPDSESIKWLNGIESQTKRMNTLIKEMLELSRLESTVAINYETVKISDLFESMTLELEAGCFEKQITLASEITPNIEIYSDKEKVDKLFSILLNNAYKYTPNGGKITVKLGVRKSNVLFSVTNTGDGIPKDKIPHLFERFYKVDESHTGEDNSFGLGLAIAKSLTDTLCGWIKCDSVEGEYTSFKVALPNGHNKQIGAANQ